jgi:hypothetical protein
VGGHRREAHERSAGPRERPQCVEEARGREVTGGGARVTGGKDAPGHGHEVRREEHLHHVAVDVAQRVLDLADHQLASASVALQRARGLVQARLVEIGEQQQVDGRGQSTRTRRAHAATGAGHQRDRAHAASICAWLVIAPPSRAARPA